MPVKASDPSAGGALGAGARDATRRLTALELFAGAGGLAIGTHAAGFDHVAVVELNKAAHATVKRNSVDTLGVDPERVLQLDASAVDYGPWQGRVDLLTGGPPCQPFSQGGGCGGHADPRNQFPALLKAVAAVRPRALLVENVKGLLRPRFEAYADYVTRRMRFPLLGLKEGEAWEEHHARLKRVGESDFALDEQYVVERQLVDAADFGVPQRRLRVFWVGFRADVGVGPFSIRPTHGLNALLRAQWVTGDYWERHGIAPETWHMNERLWAVVERLCDLFAAEEPLEPWRTVRDAIGGLPAPVLRGTAPTVADHVQHPGARPYRGHNGGWYDFPAKALKAGAHGTPGGENTVVDARTGALRYLTTREAARLQTFPETWTFDGPWGAAIKQLGNAVPVDLAARFATAIHHCLTRDAADSTHPNAQPDT